MKIGNKNPDGFRLTCIACGGDSDITLTAFRNSLGKVSGWLVACEECQPAISKDYEIIFQRMKEEKTV